MEQPGTYLEFKHTIFIDEVFAKIPGRCLAVPSVLSRVCEPLKNIVLLRGFYYNAFFYQWKGYAEIFFTEAGNLFIGSFFLFLKIICRKANNYKGAVIFTV